MRIADQLLQLGVRRRRTLSRDSRKFLKIEALKMQFPLISEGFKVLLDHKFVHI